VTRIELRPEQKRALYRGVVAGIAMLLIGLPVGAFVTRSEGSGAVGSISGAGSATPSPEPNRTAKETRRALRVRDVGPLRPNSAVFALEFDGNVSRRQREALAVLVASWVDRGIRGAFGDERFESSSDVEFLDDGRIVVASWMVDLGGVDEEKAVKAITKKFERFLVKENLAPALLLLGENIGAGAA
jgi:hypothetical protein